MTFVSFHKYLRFPRLTSFTLSSVLNIPHCLSYHGRLRFYSLEAINLNPVLFKQLGNNVYSTILPLSLIKTYAPLEVGIHFESLYWGATSYNDRLERFPY